uniref:Uncharacterized protein n=1 Tax=Chondria sp. (in: red algae) TaxID=1982705 RepID=A0A1Z1MD55_9FLOR|nr:hypothetical protein [Chondria sp. (in: red algae)]
MIDRSNLLSTYLRGSWFSQTNAYLIKHKTQRVLKKKLQLLLSKSHKGNIMFCNDNHQITAKFKIQSIRGILGLPRNILLNNNIDISIERLNLNLFKINYHIIQYNFTYEEYIYTIDNNLMFSSGILKDIGHNRYLGVIISSYIRLQN